MRSAPTPAEDVLWEHLRRDQLLGLNFRRQHAIGRFIVDFYCPARSLVIEVDGDSHIGREPEDAARQEFLEQQGLGIVRFTNGQVLGDVAWVLAAIRDACSDSSNPSSPRHRSGEGPGER
jgi:very-short-patch-repair endonuclease